MIIILGLIILIAALVVGVAGVLANGGSAHALTHFSVLGYHLTGSTGTLFLTGIVVGAAGLLGLSLLLAGTRRAARRRSAARRGLRQSRRETATASQERDDLISQRDAARATADSTLSTGAATEDPRPSPPDGDRWSTLRSLRRRLAPVQSSDSAASQPEPSVPASSLVSEEAAIHPAPDVAAGVSAPDVPARVSAPAE